MAIGKRADHASPSSDLADDALERIVRFDLAPVVAGEGEIGQRFVGFRFDELRSL
jgi:hypothetical protein